MNRTTNWTTAVMRATPKPAADEGGLGFFAIMGIIAACSVVFCSLYGCFCSRNCREQSGAGEPRQFKHRRAVISVDMMDPASYGNLV